jgi:hypothetical protein
MGVQQQVRQALVSILGGGATALGYNFIENPQGFILAVLWRELTAQMAAFANGVAARAYGLWGIFDDTVIGGLAYAIGAPARAANAAVISALVSMDRAAFLLALQLGPVGFLATPIVWGGALIGTGLMLAAVWRGYKWARTVLV